MLKTLARFFNEIKIKLIFFSILLKIKKMENTNIEIDNIVCSLCNLGDREDLLLLCDGKKCNVALHTTCINFPAVPVGDWFCPKCKNEAIPIQKKIEPGSKVVFYERVSSKGQNDAKNGRVGLDTQNFVLLKYAVDNNLWIDSTFREVGSARSLENLKVLHKIPKNKCVLVYSVSRLSRNLEEGRELIEQFHKRGGYFYSVMENISSFDPQFLQIMKNAQIESENLSKKMKETFARIKQMGGHIGVAPYGYETFRVQSGVLNLRESKEEQEIIREIKNLCDELNNDFESVKDMLNERETFRRGKKWTYSQIKSIQKNRNPVVDLNINMENMNLGNTEPEMWQDGTLKKSHKL